MKHAVLITAFLFCVVLLPALARQTLSTPATVVLRDNYDKFTATIASARHGKFDISIGESHEGEPGFSGMEKGAEFQYSIVIYHMEPGRKPLPYVPTRVAVANGRHQESVSPLFKGTRTVNFKGVTFFITPRKLTSNFGGGQTLIEVRAVEQ